MFIAVYVVLVLISAIVADARGRSAIGWLLFAIFLSPFLALLVLLCLTNRTQESERERMHREVIAAILKKPMENDTFGDCAILPTPPPPREGASVIDILAMIAIFIMIVIVFLALSGPVYMQYVQH